MKSKEVKRSSISYDQIKQFEVQADADYLLENDYIMFEDTPSVVLENMTEVMGAVKIVKPEGGKADEK